MLAKRGLGLLHLGIQIEVNQGKRVEHSVAKVNSSYFRNKADSQLTRSKRCVLTLNWQNP